MTKFDEVVEGILSIAQATLPFFDPGLGAVTSVVSWAWEKSNAKDYENIVEEKFRHIDRNKLDNTLSFDEFNALVVQTVEVASQTASKFKRKVLANALVNSVVLPTSKFPGKQALLRVVSQMSDEEIIALTVLFECETVGKDEFQLANDGKPIIPLEDVFKKVKPKMGQEWSEEDNLVAYDGLAQLGLVKAPQHIFWNSELVRTTALGNRLIQWCSDEYEKEQGSGEVSV
ncbi:MAG: hypothetical protein KME05_12210 [Gloeocapsa sp. UFS-A4-WI-NPMV-4B04]|jgi:hypothetical protein|nr:hypothetical protein [Gloeocapsa sp. UFS-A4-WI-NPMV-4B04]